MQAITIKDVLCRECGFPATLDANKTCEFCRPKKTELVTEDATWDKRDVYVLAFAIVVLGFLIYFAPMASR